MNQYTSSVDGSSPTKGTKAVSSGGGEQYTSSVSIGFGGSKSSDESPSAFSSPVKSALLSFLERRDQRIIDLALAPGDDNVAQLCWGGLNKNNPRIDGIDGDKISNGTRVISRKSKDDQPRKPDEDKLFAWKEQERFVVKTKITNPEDKEQYIWVDVVKVMVITAPSQDPFCGKMHVFEFSGKRTQVGVDEGGDSGPAAEDPIEKSSGSPTPGPSGKTAGYGTVGKANVSTGGAAAP